MNVQTSQAIPIILSLVAAMGGAFANWFYKVGANNIGEVAWHKNWYILAGLISFTSVLVLFLLAYKLGGRLFVIYPVYATTYIWAGLIGVYIDKEPWSIWQIIGVGLILMGVSMTAIGYQE